MDALPMTLVAIFRARPGYEEALGDTLRGLVGPTLAEAGCLTYDLHRSIDDPAVWFFTETWTSRAHHEAHDRSAHVVAFHRAQPDLLAEPTLLVKGVRADS
jgi:quinol monooxygenase YgiN